MISYVRYCAFETRVMPYCDMFVKYGDINRWQGGFELQDGLEISKLTLNLCYYLWQRTSNTNTDARRCKPLVRFCFPLSVHLCNQIVYLYKLT